MASAAANTGNQSSYISYRPRYPALGGDEGAENKVGQRKDDIEVHKVALVVLMVVGIEPGEPCRVLDAATLRHVHAEMKVFVKKIVDAQRGHSTIENIHVQ